MIIDPFSREEKNLGPDLTLGWVLIMIMWGVIDVESVITLHPNGPNTPTDEELDYDDADLASFANDESKIIIQLIQREK